MASGSKKVVGPGFAVLNGADRVSKGALIGFGVEGIGSDDLEGQAMADDGLPQEQANRRRQVKSCRGKQIIRFTPKVGVNPNLEGG